MSRSGAYLSGARFVDRHDARSRATATRPLRYLLADLRGRGIRRERPPARAGQPPAAPRTPRSRPRAARSAPRFRGWCWHAESPVVRTAPVPMMLLADSVRTSGYKVVLTGEGADEVFGGYDLFKEADAPPLRRARPALALAQPACCDRLYPYLAHSPASARALSASHSSRSGQRPSDAPWFAHAMRLATDDAAHPAVLQRRWRARLERWNPARRARRARCPPHFARWEPLGARPVRRGAHADVGLPALAQRRPRWRWRLRSRRAIRSSTTA